jgi:hypothetical protein
MFKSYGSQHSMYRTCGPQDMISLVIPRIGDTMHQPNYKFTSYSYAFPSLVCLLLLSSPNLLCAHYFCFDQICSALTTSAFPRFCVCHIFSMLALSTFAMPLPYLLSSYSSFALDLPLQVFFLERQICLLEHQICSSLIFNCRSLNDIQSSLLK